MRENGRRKPRLPTLGQLDLSDFDDYAIMQSGTRDAGAGTLRRIMGGPKMDLKVLGGEMDPDGVMKCWCGKPAIHTDDHDWPERHNPPALGHEHFYSASDPLFPTEKTCVICSQPDPENPPIKVTQEIEDRVHGKKKAS